MFILVRTTYARYVRTYRTVNTKANSSKFDHMIMTAKYSTYKRTVRTVPVLTVRAVKEDECSRAQPHDLITVRPPYDDKRVTGR